MVSAQPQIPHEKVTEFLNTLKVRRSEGAGQLDTWDAELKSLPGWLCLPGQLTNVVATVELGCKPDLKEVALSARNAEYNPRR